eukprot:2725674-Pyramimonas_sp.AAC.1
MAPCECEECVSGSIGSALIPELTPLWLAEPMAGSMEASAASSRCVTFSQVPSPRGRAIEIIPRSCL